MIYGALAFALLILLALAISFWRAERSFRARYDRRPGESDDAYAERVERQRHEDGLA